MLKVLTGVPEQERPAVGWAAGAFFFVICAISLLRPLREALGISGGVEHLPWAFTATFVATLAAIPAFALVVARFRARQVVPVVYHSVAAVLLAFAAVTAAGLAPQLTGRAFFVFLSVVNLFVVSVFWSVMADGLTTEQASRLFAVVAAGGSAGAVAGPLLAGALSAAGAPALFVMGALSLEGALLCLARFVRWSAASGAGSLAGSVEQPMGGGVLAGLRLLVRSKTLLLTAALVVLFTWTSTFLYLEQARIVRDAFASTAERTRFFANVDLAVNVLTISLQLLVSGRLLVRLGLGAALAVLPVVTGAGLVLLAASPTTLMLAGVQGARRALHHALDRPAREASFTFAAREEKYKSKSVIDTLLYRGGDAAGGWAHAGLGALGLSPAGLLLATLPACALWLMAALGLGRRTRATTDPTVENLDPCPSRAAT